ncbi:phage portal protein [Clostridium sp.]|uniref:phage portal protein n=1 Tax=Clostridium sp. TaxID=1506 RepID=UPI00260F06DB|nr:phage portal protein [Clostridium sp.]
MIFNKIKEAKREKRDANIIDWKSVDSVEAFLKGYDYELTTVALREQTYLNAINILSSTVAKIPINIKQTTENGDIDANNYYLNDILTLRANDNMTQFEAFKALIMLYKHWGMAGLYIDRGLGGKCIGLYPVRIDNFTVDTGGLINSTKQNKVMVDFTCYDSTGYCWDSDIIILRDNSLDGIRTRASRSYLSEVIDTSLQAQSYQNDLFSNGLTSKLVVQTTSDIKTASDLTTIQNKFKSLYSKTGGIFTVPAGYTIDSINIDLQSSQFAELKEMSKKDIAGLIGVPFALVNNGVLTEQEQISYITNTIIPILTQLQQEMDYKLIGLDRKKGYKIRFNYNDILKVDAQTQQNIVCNYVRNGVYSLEYARKLLGIESDFENETVTLPSGQVLLSDLLTGNTTWQGDKTSPRANADSKGGDLNE